MVGMAAANDSSMEASCPSAPYFMGWPNHFDKNPVETALPHSPRFNPIKTASGVIADIDALCKALDITRNEFDDALKIPPEERYKKRDVPKKDGSSRSVNNPHYLIRKIQRRINRRIFANPNVILWPDHVFGSVPNDNSSASPYGAKDYINCARQHCEAKSVLSVDIKDFFDNIHAETVKGIFTEFLKYGDEVSDALTNLCCNGKSIVQGALTSSYIATLCLHTSEGLAVNRLRHKGLVYTRLVDDITVSSKAFQYDFNFAIRQIEQMLDEANLPINKNKTRIQYASMSPLIVHGLRIDFNQPRLPPDEPGKIRASVKNLELLAASPGYRASRAYRKDFNRCLGRVNKLSRVGHSQHPKLLCRLQRILPLPSHKDIERSERQVSRLEKDSLKPGYVETYWFHKRWYVASERLSILKRS